jgi:hypothetical protein
MKSRSYQVAIRLFYATDSGKGTCALLHQADWDRCGEKDVVRRV